MKKTIICCLILLAMVLAGCNGDGNTPADTTPSPVVTTPAPVEETTPAETTPAETTPAETTTEAPVETTTPAPETTPAPVETTAPSASDEVKVEYMIGTISGAAGLDTGNTKRFRCIDFIPVGDFTAITIGDGYYLTWFAYDKDYTYLGNGSNTYPTLPEKGVWLALGADITAAEILAWNADTAYVRFAVKRADEGKLDLDNDVPISEIKVVK